MASPDLIRQIHDSGRQAVIAVTGGGSGAISALLQTPGASRSVLAAAVPYSAPALADWLGGAPEHACSEPTARAMAMASYLRARQFVGDAHRDDLVGVGGTASLASDRPKRGEHRVHVAVQTAQMTASISLLLAKGRRDRGGEEDVAARLVIATLACGVGVREIDEAANGLDIDASEQFVFDREDATPELADLLTGVRRKLALLPPGEREPPAAVEHPSLPVVFPGAFNPPHAGHQRMAAIAEQRLGQPVAWEVSIANVDKPPLDFIAIRDRLAGLAAVDRRRLILLTHAATFREKAALAPGAVFVVGLDTLMRIADARYYAGDPKLRDDALTAIAAAGCRFLVFGRQLGGHFQTLADLHIPPELRAICDEVPAEKFREDISSTELRASGSDFAT